MVVLVSRSGLREFAFLRWPCTSIELVHRFGFRFKLPRSSDAASRPSLNHDVFSTRDGKARAFESHPHPNPANNTR